MVTIKDFKLHENAEGKKYVSLEIIGDIEMVQSKQTGRFYASVKRCFISSVLDEATARLMVGKSTTGSIIKKECEPYDYPIAGTGEKVSLNYKYDYVPY